MLQTNITISLTAKTGVGSLGLILANNSF